MIFIHLTPTGNNVDGKVADLKLTYRLPGSSEPHTETITLAYPNDPTETPTDTYLSTPEMAERYAMYNVFLGLRFATVSYNASCATAALQSTRTAAQTWNATHEDPDIAADIQLLDMYIANLAERGAYADTSIATCGADNPYGDEPGYYYGDDQQVYGCSAGGNSRGPVLLLIAAVFVTRRRRRR
jgi:MYXO-CTERM domain-containing protein